MDSRHGRAAKKSESYTANIDIFIERLKKVRALNCSPSDVGMDAYVLKRLLFNKFSIMTSML